MSGIVYRKNNSNVSLTGTQYVNPTTGTMRLCVRDANGNIVKYGFTTNTSASQYSPTFYINGTKCYIGRIESSASISTYTARKITLITNYLVRNQTISDKKAYYEQGNSSLVTYSSNFYTPIKHSASSSGTLRINNANLTSTRSTYDSYSWQDSSIAVYKRSFGNSPTYTAMSTIYFGINAYIFQGIVATSMFNYDNNSQLITATSYYGINDPYTVYTLSSTNTITYNNINK